MKERRQRQRKIVQVEGKETEIEEDCSRLKERRRRQRKTVQVEGKETEIEEDCSRLRKRDRDRKAGKSFQDEVKETETGTEEDFQV